MIVYLYLLSNHTTEMSRVVDHKLKILPAINIRRNMTFCLFVFTQQ